MRSSVLLALLFMAACDAPVQPEITVQEAPEPEVIDDSLAGEAVRIEVRGLLLSRGGLKAAVSTLDGQLVPLTEGQVPVLENPRTYRVEMEQAEVAMELEGLARILDHEMSRKKKQPLKELKLGTIGDRLVMKGKLKALSIPFEVEVRPFAASEGRLGLELKEAKALGIPLDKVLGAFNVDLEDLAEVKDPAIKVVENTLVVDVFRFVKEPDVRGSITGVRVERDGLVIRVGEEGEGRRPAGTTVDAAMEGTGHQNYIAITGGSIRVGRSTMHGADIILVDDDDKDPLHLSAEGYDKQQLAAYIKMQPDGGFTQHMPDWEDMGAEVASAADE